ncbi:MAG: APC family permease [Candidatus Eremiobacteraeota bacterium]|nr:APC family permease [Candidatus Eremiobacteraeota bacterium]
MTAGDTLPASPSGAAAHLRRVLGLRDLVVVAGASMGPAFSVATTLAAMLTATGRWTWLAVLIVTALMAMIASGYKRLGERVRDAGSSYAWIRTAFGPVAGAYGAWILLVANVFAILATALPAGAYTLDLLAPALVPNGGAVALAACGWIAATALLLWYGLRPTTMLTLALLVAEVLVLLAAASASAGAPRPEALAFSGTPLAWGALGPAIVLGVWLLDGWEACASTSEEAHGAASIPGAGALVGLILTSLLVLGATWAFARIGSAQGFAEHEDDALAYVGGLLGGWWPRVLIATVLVSLAASLQATLVYLSRSVYAMGRDGVLPRAFGALDRRAQPAWSILSITVLALAFTLATGLVPKAKDVFDVVLKGTAWYTGALFVITAAAAVRIFGPEGTARWSGAVLPGSAAAVLAAVLVQALKTDDPLTRGFIAASAIIGLPLALWRGRSVRRAAPSGGGPTTGSRF